MPELAPYVSDAETWAERRVLYAEVLARPDTVLLLALDGEALVGYALAHVVPVRETWIAEIESLSVAPEHRGRGIGTALMDALDRELEALGIGDVIVGAVAGNEVALSLYRRRGFRPTWLYLSRFEGR